MGSKLVEERRSRVLPEKKPKKTRRDMEMQLVKKAREDAAFREKVIRNPAEAIKQALGLTVPKGIAVEVREEKPNELYLILPVDPNDVELPDELLELAAGSCRGSCNCVYAGMCT